MLMIPLASPKANYLAHKDEIDAAVSSVLQSGSYILGREVSAFEAEFAAYMGVPHAVGVASGTDALQLALRAVDVGPGDEVITVSHTAVATVAAIDMVGATPVLVDVEKDSLTMDTARVCEAVSAQTKAIIVVHLYGRAVDLDLIRRLADAHGLALIEDCAQAHGALYLGRKLGTFGDAGCFSFYPTKNLGALGDGGMIVTNKPNLDARMRSLREYGWRRRYVSEVRGYNSRLDEVQAAILRVKLRFLDQENNRRRELAAAYRQPLKDTRVFGLQDSLKSEDVFHLYVVRHPQRDQLRSWLEGLGIGTGVHYPVPVHLQPAYAHLGYKPGSLPVTEQAAAEIVSLPMFPELRDHEVATVGEAVRRFDGVISSS